MRYGYEEFIFNKKESFLENLARLRSLPWARNLRQEWCEDFIRKNLFNTSVPHDCWIVRVIVPDSHPVARYSIRDYTPYPPEHEAPSQISIHIDGIDLPAGKRAQEIYDTYLDPKHQGVMKNILDKAKETVDSNRQSEYGDPVENWVATALIATITQRKPITPEDVIQVMTAQKSVRAGRGHKEDTNVDQAGYAEIRERVQKAWKDGTVQKIVEKLLGGWVKFDTQSKPEPMVTGIVTEIECRRDYRAEWHSARPEGHITLKIDMPITAYGKIVPGQVVAVKP